MAKHISRKMQKALKEFDQTKIYTPLEAAEIVKKVSYSKFDGTVNVDMKLNLDTTKAEQQLRGTISLPNGNGKSVRILVISDTITKEQAKEANIDFFGGKDKIEDIKTGWLDFDLIITTPKFMPELSKLGKILGPKGLMPNPKTQTVTNDVITTAKEFKKGKFEYRTDSFGNIHSVIGKVSFDSKKLAENLTYMIETIRTKRPSTVKGEFIQNVTLSPTMGPGIKVKFN